MNRRILIVSLLALGLAAFLCQSSMAQEKYEAKWKSLDKRPIPSWYKDAKFGIFIHWGVYAVPAFAPKGKYAEWYWNQIGGPIQGNPEQKREGESWEFHKKNYGANFEYHQFAPMFKAELFNPTEWAEIFKESGAKYVALTSKHHDGFCMFPSKEANQSWGRAWNSADTGPHRDLLGDLSDAVRKEGLKMGFYYSLYEWYNPLWQIDKKTYIEKHMIPQFKDVVTRYKPSIIFSDGEWDLPSSDWKSEELLAWLFNDAPSKDDVVVNDRWGKECRHHHGDYYTTEYGSGMANDVHPWEENRGMGFSYGYNRNEDLKEYRTSRELVLMFVDLVSRGGNLLLNIGPNGDGRIPVVMEERLRDMGKWLKVNGEAIYGTRPWKTNCQWSEGQIPKVEYGGEFQVKYDINEVTKKKSSDKSVVEAFLTKKENDLFAVCPIWPGDTFTLKNVTPSDSSEITMLGMDGKLSWEKKNGNIVITLPKLHPGEAPCEYGYTLKITNVK